MSKSFSDRLTKNQVQQVLDALGIQWREHEPNEEGWIDISDLPGFNSDVGINIYHGGFNNHYLSGLPSDPNSSGDIVQCVEMLMSCTAKQAIHWIKEILGLGPPTLSENQMFAKDWIIKDDNYCAWIPAPVLKSELSSSAKVVWGAISKRCGKGKFCSWAGIRKLAEDTCMSKTTVNRAITELKQNDFLIEVQNMRSHKAPKRYPVVKQSGVPEPDTLVYQI